MTLRHIVPIGLLIAALPALAAGPRARETAEQAAPALRRLRSPAVRPLGRGDVVRRVYVVVDRLTPECRRALEAAGVAVELPAADAAAPAWPGGELAQGTIRVSALGALRALPCVRRIVEPGTPVRNVGSAVTAGDRLLKVESARQVLGTDGTGVSIGVISDGVDHQSRSVVTGDLPANVLLPAIEGLGSGDGDEGTAMLEIVHDLAPGAGLMFAAPRTSAEMVRAIDGLAAAGATIIVDDLVFTDEPKFEDGPIARAAARFAAAGGLYVTSAGNFARGHYFARYRPTEASALRGGDYPAMHDFGGDDIGDTLVVPPGASVDAVLQWNEPFGGARTDLDLVLARSASGGDVVLAAGVDAQRGDGDPYERLQWENDSGETVEAYLAIAEFRRAVPAEQLRVNVVFLRSGIRQQYVVPKESVFGHAMAPEVIGVAAAPARRPRRLERFSSRGPATVFFPAPEIRQAPRVTAIDGVSTAVGRAGFFGEPFFGTSASAPHVAGCLALLRAAGARPATALAAMLDAAVDIDRRGFDRASGAGLVDCAAAGRAVAGAAQ